MSEIEADIQRQCAALGIDPNFGKTTDDKIYDAVLAIAKREKRPTRTAEIEDACGVDPAHAIKRMLANGRLIRIEAGRYIPRVV